MKEKVYVKTTKDNIWANNPVVATLIFFTVFYIFVVMNLGLISRIFGPLDIVVVFVLPAYILLKLNLRHNISKSTAFIACDGHMYAIQLFETKKKLVEGDNRSTIYMPSGTIAQAATLPNNAKAAKQTLAYENEIRERRDDKNSFLIGLDDVKRYRKEHPNEIEHYSDLKGYEKFVKDHGENCGLIRSDTDKANYTFAELKSPQIEKVGLKTFWISFNDEQNVRRKIKFTKCYGDLIDDIKKKNY